MVHAILGALTLTGIGVAHSALGERLILRPLLARPLPPPLGRFHARTLRLAWHATTLAWWGLAWALVWPDALAWAAAVVLAATAVIGFVGTRGQHLSWPAFGVATYAAACAGAGRWLLPSGGARTAVAVALTLVLSALAALHVYWAAGGRWGLARALPEVDGVRLFAGLTSRVAAAATALVAVALAALAALPWLTEAWAPARAVLGGAAVLFSARVIGDLRTVGVLKRVRGTAFARADDLVYSPLCFALGAGLGALAVL